MLSHWPQWIQVQDNEGQLWKSESGTAILAAQKSLVFRRLCSSNVTDFFKGRWLQRNWTTMTCWHCQDSFHSQQINESNLEMHTKYFYHVFCFFACLLLCVEKNVCSYSVCFPILISLRSTSGQCSTSWQDITQLCTHCAPESVLLAMALECL